MACLAKHIFLILLIYSVEAKDFGKMGHSFEIKEEGFLAMIFHRLKSLDIEKEQKKMQNLVTNSVNEPSRVVGVTNTIKERSFTFDPTYIVREDIKFENGEILHKAGTKVNPLDHMDFDRKLIFIDGSHKEQVSWLKRQLNCEQEIRVILIAGRPIDLSETFGFHIYFDQFGELTKKFGIKQVPAIIEQEGKLIRIKEIKHEKE